MRTEHHVTATTTSDRVAVKTNPLTIVAYVLAIIGALNWGLVGAFSFDLVAALFGPMSTLSRLIYILVGLAGIWLIFAGFTYLGGPRSVTTTRTVP